MPFDGNGVFIALEPPTYPAVSGTVIEAEKYNDNTNDIHEGLSNVLTRDGQRGPSADLPMDNFNFTDLRPAEESGEALTWGQAAIVLTPLQYGAVGNGTTNDATAFAAMLSAANDLLALLPTAHLVVDLCGRTYATRTTLNFSVDTLLVQNGGFFAVGTTLADEEDNLIVISGDGVVFDNVLINGKKICSCVEVTGDYVKITNCVIQGWFKATNAYGVYYSGGNYLVVENSLIQRIGEDDADFITAANHAGFGIVITRPDADFINNRITSCAQTMHIEGVGVDRIRVVGGEQSQNGAGLVVKTDSRTVRIEGVDGSVQFSGVHFHSGNIVLSGSSNVGFEGCSASWNAASNPITASTPALVYLLADGASSASPRKFSMGVWHLNTSILIDGTIPLWRVNQGDSYAGDYTKANDLFEGGSNGMACGPTTWVGTQNGTVPMLTYASGNEANGTRVAIVDANTTDVADPAYWRSRGDYIEVFRPKMAPVTLGAGTGGTYVLGPDEAGCLVRCVAVQTLTFDTSVPEGWWCDVLKYTASAVNFAESAGVDILTPTVGGATPWAINTQNSIVRCWCVQNDDDATPFIVIQGDIST